jgi:tRNA A-37 threonylcarbamoyl transferase component Bud32
VTSQPPVPADKAELLSKLDVIERDAAALPLPRPFGPYTLLSLLARGGMGEVFLARTGNVAGLERLCVVKCLRPHLTSDREYVARFIDEARIVVQLTHKNIGNVFDVGRDVVDGRLYLAMELISGVDLRAITDVKQQAFPGELAVHVVAEVLEALDYAHHRSEDLTGRPLMLVHRDVSPHNIMISFEGEVKLIDFGLASSVLKMEQTAPQVVMGKLAYMSPEHIRGERLDGRTDQFSVGVLATELLLGGRFYGDLSSYDVWKVAADGTHRPTEFASLDRELRDVLNRALAHKPEDRFPSALAFREALLKAATSYGWRGDGPRLKAMVHEVCAGTAIAQREHVQEAVRRAAAAERVVQPPVRTPPAMPAYSASVRVQEPDRRRWFAAGVFALIAAAAGVWIWMSPSRPPAQISVPITPVEPSIENVVDAAPTPTPAQAREAATLALTEPQPLKHKKSTTPRQEKLQRLKRCENPCAAPLVDDAKRFGALSPQEMLRLDASIQRCLTRCR